MIKKLIGLIKETVVDKRKNIVSNQSKKAVLKIEILAINVQRYIKHTADCRGVESLTYPSSITRLTSASHCLTFSWPSFD